METKHPTLGTILKERRAVRSLSQRTLGYLAGVDAGYISLIESGKVKNPRARLLRALASALCCTVDDLIPKE